MTIEYSGRGDPKRSMELLWGTRGSPSRGPKPGLSVEQIVNEAIALADTEGLRALAMHRIAKALGVTTMALYRYVPSKAELLDIMLDRVRGEVIKTDTAAGSWRAKLELCAREDWALYHRHPWVLQVAMPRPPMGPNVIGAYEAILQAVAGIGLTAKEMTAVVELISEYVQGSARNSLNAIEVARHTGMTDEEWWRSLSSFLEPIFDSSRYPTLTQIAAAGAFDEPEAQKRAEANFEFGLQRVLDGIQAHLESRLSPSSLDTCSE